MLEDHAGEPESFLGAESDFWGWNRTSGGNIPLAHYGLLGERNYGLLGDAADQNRFYFAMNTDFWGSKSSELLFRKEKRFLPLFNQHFALQKRIMFQ